MNEKLKSMALAIADASISPNRTFSYKDESLTLDELNAKFKEELEQYCGGGLNGYSEYRNHKNEIFDLISQGVNEVLPARVHADLGLLCEVKEFGWNELPTFTVRVSAKSRARGKKFVTRVGEGARYEVFKLDGYNMTIKTTAYGGAAQISLNDIMTGKLALSEVFDIIVEGMEDRIYEEMSKGIASLIKVLPSANKHTAASFDQAEFDKLLTVADSYGKATIYCTQEMAGTIVPENGWVSDAHRNAMWEKGYLGNYKGHTVVILPQSFTDADNTTKVIDPSKAIIIPSGAEKPVKIAMQGSAVTDESKNEDFSQEIKTFKKFGVGIVNTNPGICVYENTALQKA